MAIQNDRESILGKLQMIGSVNNFTQSENYGPNVAMIRCEGFRIIRGKIPAAVRKELMSAVKSGQLGRIKKTGLRDEVFFHPNSKGRAMDALDKEFNSAIKAISKVCVPHSKFD